MLRISIHEEPGSLTVKLEGTLVGPWAGEAESYWQRTLAIRPQTSRLDLTGVTMIDAAGKAFLAAAHAKGAALVASGCLMRAIVAEITCSTSSECECPGQ